MYVSSMRRGFTLIELLIVIALIGILSAIGIPAYVGYLQNARDKDAQTSLRTLAAAQETYLLKSGNYFATTGTSASSSTSCDSCCSATLNNTSELEATLLKGMKGATLNSNYYYYCTYVNNAVTPPTYTVKASSRQSNIIFYITQDRTTSATNWTQTTF